MYDRIRIPLDGSSVAEAALDVARLIPSRLAYLLRVEQDAPQVEHYISPSGHETQRRIVFRENDEYLERISDAFRTEDREVEVLQSWGDPADRIVETAADVDLIVMATHGREAAGRILHGSVADRVTREASAPVLLVRTGGKLPLPRIARILVPLDGSELAETAMSTAVTMARALGLAAHLVCVVDTQRAERTGALGTRLGAQLAAHAPQPCTLVEQAARMYLTDCVQRHGNEMAITSEVRSGAAITELRTAIEPSDLVVMTTHGHRGLRRLVLGSVADALVRQASAPVLLLRADTVRPDTSVDD
jgi:nucleotide-binding universal stress UspA family protein